MKNYETTSKNHGKQPKTHKKPWNNLEIPWKPTKNHEKPWNYLENLGHQPKTMKLPWKTMKVPWKTMETNEKPKLTDRPFKRCSSSSSSSDQHWRAWLPSGREQTHVARRLGRHPRNDSGWFSWLLNRALYFAWCYPILSYPSIMFSIFSMFSKFSLCSPIRHFKVHNL